MSASESMYRVTKARGGETRVLAWSETEALLFEAADSEGFPERPPMRRGRRGGMFAAGFSRASYRNFVRNNVQSGTRERVGNLIFEKVKE